MGLRRVAERDLGAILTETQCGFGWPIVLISPRGERMSLTGFSNDIAELIDPDTGQAVSGRLASVALRMSSLPRALPQGVANTSERPWLVEFEDIIGQAWRFAVRESNPDRGLGLQILILELYQ